MINPAHLKIEIWPPRQTGGQICGPGPQGVKITHLPSDMEAISVSERSQHRNKEIAMAMIEGGLTSTGYRGAL